MLVIAASALALALLAAGTIGSASAEPAAPPYQQMRDGTPLEMVQCADGKVLLQKGGRPACVMPATADRLEARGWEAVRAAELQPSAARSDGTPPRPDTDPQADGGDAIVYDPLYIIDGKIYLGGVEKRLPNPTGVWLPVTREDAEGEVMPRLAGGAGDELILPAVAVSEYGSNDSPLYRYDTERGNSFTAQGVNGYPDVITKINYFVYPPGESLSSLMNYERTGNVAEEASLLEGRNGFLRSLMENAGFRVSNVEGSPTNARVYSGANPSMSVVSLTGDKGEYLNLKFRGWASQAPPDGYILAKQELKSRIDDFVARHTDVFNDRCIFTQKDADIYNAMVVAGVPLYSASVGHCTSVLFPDSGPRTQSVLIEATEGEIIWFTYRPYLVGDWLDRLDIPESAKVRHDG